MEKAYDSVDRDRLIQLMDYMGIGSNNFFSLLKLAMSDGEVAIVSSSGLSSTFSTSRGNK